MPRPGSGNMIVYGRIEIAASDASLADVLQALGTILERHGYPEQDIAEAKKQETEEAKTAETEARKMLDDYERQMNADGEPVRSTVVPWKK